VRAIAIHQHLHLALGQSLQLGYSLKEAPFERGGAKPGQGQRTRVHSKGSAGIKDQDSGLGHKEVMAGTHPKRNLRPATPQGESSIEVFQPIGDKPTPMNWKHTFLKPASLKQGSPHPMTEVLIAPFSKLEQRLDKLSELPFKLAPESLALWDRLRKSVKKGEKLAANRIHFLDGSQLALVFVDPKVSTYTLHTELRKSLEDLFSNPPQGMEILINLRHLERATTQRVALALGALSQMASWKPEAFGKKAEEAAQKKKATHQLHWLSSITPRELEQWVHEGTALGEANNLGRTLADLPSNELNPLHYRNRAKAFAKEHGLSFEFWSIAELEKKKAGAFLAVNRADPKSEAGIAILKYVPSKRKSAPVLALVGKGLCFDTGGYNVKTGNYMLGMHGDMTGSALALALCGYFAKIQAPFEVHAYLALAENLISPTAYKPNDVVIACDGTAIEVVDTDAEGRMVLSDTLALVRKTKPQLCIDYATLTGAAIRSLDTRRGAVFSNQSQLAQWAVQAGDESGERTWNFPIGGDYREVLKSKVADILQCAPVNNADHIYAATFLSHFIGDETPWVHLDLVPAENKGGLGLASSDTTGFGVFWTQALVSKVLTSKKGSRK
jgi:leucyl aminopeptidase